MPYRYLIIAWLSTAVGLVAPLDAVAQDPANAPSSPGALRGLAALNTTFTLEPGGPEQYDDETRALIERFTGGLLAQRLAELGVRADEAAPRLDCSFRSIAATEEANTWAYRVSVSQPDDGSILWAAEGEIAGKFFGGTSQSVGVRGCGGAFRIAYETANPPRHGLALVSEVVSENPATREFGVAAISAGRFYLVRDNPPPIPGRAGSRGGIRILAPESAGASYRTTDIDLPELIGVGSFEMQGRLAYALCNAWDLPPGAETPTNFYSGLRVFDLSDPAAPLALGSLEVEAPPGSWSSLTVSGSLAVISSSRGTPGNRNVTVALDLVDVGNPAEPRFLSSVDLPGASDNVGDLEIAGTLLLVAARQSGLYLFDVEDTEAPVFLSRYEPSSWSRGVVVNGSHVYLSVSMTRNASAIHVLDISDPASPRLVTEVDTFGPAQRMALMGHRLYLADHASGLGVYDVSTPSAPALLGRYLPDGPASSAVFTEVAAADGLVAAWGSSGNLWLFRAASGN